MAIELSQHIFNNLNLSTSKIMQLGTVSGGKPWISSVYFVIDEDLRMYWLSYPTRRHSQDIEQNKNVAITVAVKTDRPVIGVQAEGTADTVDDLETVQKIMELYVNKYKEGEKFYENLVNKRNKHTMYRFTPARYLLFDEVNFPQDGSQELKC